MFSNFYFEKSVLMSLMMIIRPLARGATADKHLCCDWLKARPACGWLGASVIDSSTWVVGGSDRPVAVETNTASRPANRRRGRAPGIHLTHAEDFLSTRTHINTHRHTHTYSSCALLFGWIYECMCVKVYLCACAYACVRWVHVCVLPVRCGRLSTQSPGRWRSCHGRVLSSGPVHTHTLTLTHTHTHTPGGGQGVSLY